VLAGSQSAPTVKEAAAAAATLLEAGARAIALQDRLDYRHQVLFAATLCNSLAAATQQQQQQ
jgi:hypothetical protein